MACDYNRLNSTTEPKSLTEQAVCGLSSKDFAYCPLKAGDESVTRTFDLIQEFWKTPNECHMLSPYTCQSALETEGVWAAQASDYELMYYHELQNVEDCVKTVFHTDYWQNIYPNSRKEVLAQFEDYNFGIAKTSLGFIAMILSVFIIIAF